MYSQEYGTCDAGDSQGNVYVTGIREISEGDAETN